MRSWSGSVWGTPALLLGLSASLGGCFFFDTEEHDEGPPPYQPSPCPDTSVLSQGELGLLEFSYDWGALGCVFGCGAHEAIAEGSQVQITAYGEVELPPIAVTSDASEVAEFSVGEDGDIHVTAHAPGEVRLEIRDGESGEILEKLRLVVKPVTSIGPQGVSGEDVAGGMSVMVEGSTAIHLDLLDELGCRMVGVGGVDYRLEGGISERELTVVDAITAWIFEGIVGSAVTEYLSLDARALGSGTIVASAPSGAGATIPIAVVDASAVAALSLSAPPSPFAVGSSNTVTARALDAGGKLVYSPACSWSLTPATGAVELESGERDMAFVSASAAGSAQVRCDVGSAYGTVDVTFQ
jgi:hypothetical protein